MLLSILSSSLADSLAPEVQKHFLKINQSCLVRVDAIERFSASIGGALSVHLKGGFKDYVSRRQMRSVKERMGF